jgi:hypothetical protein
LVESWTSTSTPTPTPTPPCNDDEQNFPKSEWGFDSVLFFATVVNE